MKSIELKSGVPYSFIWTPESKPRALILVVHGMTEHAGRYEGFAGEMAAAGIAVAAFDLRGHGRNASDPDCTAMKQGEWEKSILDIHRMILQLRELYPGLPLYLLGFSLGSFLVREYMEREDAQMDGVILMGTGWQPGWLLSVMRTLVGTQIMKAGFEHTTPLIRQLSFGAYNGRFRPSRTGSDWLCSDDRELDDYLADPLCRRDIASGTFYELLGSMQRTGRKLKHQMVNETMPVLLLAGGDDPVGDFGKGSAAVERILKEAGYPVYYESYPGARHMLLGEEAGYQAPKAREEILRWLNAVL